MEAYAVIVSSHGKPRSVHLFETEAEARTFAITLKDKESWEDKSHHGHDHGDHTHESHWLEDWGDDDGCGVVVGTSESSHSHAH